MSYLAWATKYYEGQHVWVRFRGWKPAVVLTVWSMTMSVEYDDIAGTLWIYNAEDVMTDEEYVAMLLTQ